MTNKTNLRETINSTNEVVDALKSTVADAKDGKVKLGVIVRLVLLVIAWVNQIAVIYECYNLPNISEDVVYLIATTITVTITVIVYWKNNSWTINAKTADAILDLLRDSGISSDDIIDAIVNIVDTKNETSVKNTNVDKSKT